SSPSSADSRSSAWWACWWVRSSPASSPPPCASTAGITWAWSPSRCPRPRRPGCRRAPPSGRRVDNQPRLGERQRLMPTSARPSVRPLSGAPLLFVLLFLIGPAAWAQKAVVTDLRNDRRDRLQGQIAESLSRIEGLEVVSRAEWQKLAASKKITLVRSRNAAGVRALAPEARVSIAVTCTVNSAGTRLRVQLMNAKGEVLSTRVLNLRRRLLRPADLNRLGNAVLAAVQVAEPPAAPEAAPAAKAAEEKAEPETPTEPLVSDAPAPAEPSATAESPRPAGEVLGREPVISFRLSGSARWRSACMAPAVDSCVTYKSLEPA